jgi:hypothetical protein
MSFRLASWMGSCIAVGLLTVALSATAQDTGQGPALRPESIEGPWEFTNALGIDGIFLKVETGHANNGRRVLEDIAWRTVDIRIYHRSAGSETWGYFASGFDGTHLRIHFVELPSDKVPTQPRPKGFPQPLTSFDLDVTFSLAERHWTGTWSREGQLFNVVLERPQPSSAEVLSPFIGDWEGNSGGSLHIRQSSDGALNAWLDRTIATDQRNGERLNVVSAARNAVVLDLDTAFAPGFSYHGTLSEDGQALTGTWVSSAAGMGLNAPSSFRRSR